VILPALNYNNLSLSGLTIPTMEQQVLYRPKLAYPSLTWPNLTLHGITCSNVS